MLYKFNLEKRTFLPLEEVDFASLKILERQDIERWVEEQPDIVGEDLLIVTTEYDKFDKTNERLDVLAIDKNGKIVILELKRDDSGKNVDLQALKYAAFCSTFTLEEIINERVSYLKKKGKIISNEDVRNEIEAFIENADFKEIDDKPRIILISKEFRPEVTASVLWLRTFQVDIICIKLTPYRIDQSEIGISAQKIIPLPEAEEFQIQVEKKESGTKELSKSQKEYKNLWNYLKTQTEKVLNIKLKSAPVSTYYSIPSGIGNIHFEWVLQKKRNLFGVEVHFENSQKEKNYHNLNLLKQYFDDFGKRINNDAIIEENWGKRWSRVYFKIDQILVDDKLKKFAVDIMIELYQYLKPIFDKKKKDGEIK